MFARTWGASLHVPWLRRRLFAATSSAQPSLPPTAERLSLNLAQPRSADGLRRYKPTSPGTRHRVIIDKSWLWKGPPLKQLTVGISSSGGRNNMGRTTVWGRGGGNKRKLRIIDFKRSRLEEPATVERLEYDPNRSAFIALVRYPDKAPSYILAPEGLHPGDTVTSHTDGAGVDIKVGLCLPLGQMPTGVVVHNVELHPGRGGQLVRSAGSSATVLTHVDKYALLRMPSGEQRKVLSSCRATIGAVSNAPHKLRSLGKAGANRWMGRRPKVRGVAMNPVDHPHGGGTQQWRGVMGLCAAAGVCCIDVLHPGRRQRKDVGWTPIGDALGKTDQGGVQDAEEGQVFGPTGGIAKTSWPANAAGEMMVRRESICTLDSFLATQ